MNQLRHGCVWHDAQPRCLPAELPRFKRMDPPGPATRWEPPPGTSCRCDCRGSPGPPPPPPAPSGGSPLALASMVAGPRAPLDLTTDMTPTVGLRLKVLLKFSSRFISSNLKYFISSCVFRTRMSFCAHSAASWRMRSMSSGLDSLRSVSQSPHSPHDREKPVTNAPSWMRAQLCSWMRVPVLEPVLKLVQTLLQNAPLFHKHVLRATELRLEAAGAHTATR